MEPMPEPVMPISIHTFLAEGDIKIKEWAIGTDISIHTFLAEGDQVVPETSVAQENFNPHLPRGR